MIQKERLAPLAGTKNKKMAGAENKLKKEKNDKTKDY